MILMNGAYYLWARRQIEVEVSSDFESLRSLQAPLASNFLLVMKSLPQSMKIGTWKSLLKRFHVEGSKAVGDPLIETDRRVIQQYDEMRRFLIATSEPKINYVQTISPTRFQQAASSALQDILQVSPEQSAKKLLRFVSNYRNGVVHTYLDAGSTRYQLCYWHDVITPSGQLVRDRCSVLEWFGVSSQTYWYEASEDQMSSIIASLKTNVIKFCSFCDSDWVN